MKKTDALATLRKLSSIQKIDYLLKQSAAIAYYSLHKKHDAPGFRICNLFIDDRKQIILSCRSIGSEVERCVLSAGPDWLITYATQSLVTCTLITNFKQRKRERERHTHIQWYTYKVTRSHTHTVTHTLTKKQRKYAVTVSRLVFYAQSTSMLWQNQDEMIWKIYISCQYTCRYNANCKTRSAITLRELWIKCITGEREIKRERC